MLSFSNLPACENSFWFNYLHLIVTYTNAVSFHTHTLDSIYPCWQIVSPLADDQNSYKVHYVTLEYSISVTDSYMTNERYQKLMVSLGVF